MDSTYFAVRPDLVVLAKELFRVRPSALEAGEKRLLLTAQAIANGRRQDRWGHHTEAVIRKFCASTASSGQPPLPWQELLEDAHLYDGVEGVASRTGNRPLGTTSRYLVDVDRLSAALADAGASPAHLAETESWPAMFVEALLDGRWPSVSEPTARRLQQQFAEAVATPITSQSAVPDVPPDATMTRGHVGGILALVALVIGGAGWWLRGTVPTSLDQARSSELVGYWDYDEIDGRHLAQGVRLLEAPGAALGTRWQYRLELVDHAELPARQRQLWPVELHRDARRVCINYPGYPTYAAYVDAPEDEADGVYLFGPCD